MGVRRRSYPLLNGMRLYKEFKVGHRLNTCRLYRKGSGSQLMYMRLSNHAAAPFAYGMVVRTALLKSVSLM